MSNKASPTAEQPAQPTSQSANNTPAANPEPGSAYQAQQQDDLQSPDKPRLTEQEKKNNHIVSEQKRRQAIREGFDELADIVPGLKGQGRSEAIVLQGAVVHIKKMLAERYRLIETAEHIGSGRGIQGPPPPSLGALIEKYRLDTDTMRIAKTYHDTGVGSGDTT